jgi:hypothetical protein
MGDPNMAQSTQHVLQKTCPLSLLIVCKLALLNLLPSLLKKKKNLLPSWISPNVICKWNVDLLLWKWRDCGASACAEPPLPSSQTSLHRSLIWLQGITRSGLNAFYSQFSHRYADRCCGWLFFFFANSWFFWLRRYSESVVYPTWHPTTTPTNTNHELKDARCKRRAQQSAPGPSSNY